MHVLRILAVLAIAATFGLAAGCGDDDDEDTAASEATTTEEAAAGGGGAIEVGMTSTRSTQRTSPFRKETRSPSRTTVSCPTTTPSRQGMNRRVRSFLRTFATLPWGPAMSIRARVASTKSGTWHWVSTR
jgi:hypothetical protein